jgi:hypothetical protein
LLERSMLDVATIDALPDAEAAPAVARPLTEVQPRWNRATRLAFRLGFLYFTLDRPA